MTRLNNKAHRCQGGGADGNNSTQGETQTGQPVVDPQVKRNDEIFKEALRRVTGEDLDKPTPQNNPQQTEGKLETDKTEESANNETEQ